MLYGTSRPRRLNASLRRFARTSATTREAFGWSVPKPWQSLPWKDFGQKQRAELVDHPRV
jgi:hypothetical protein